MDDSFRGDWLLMAAAKWQPVGRHMAEAMSKGLGSGD